MTTAAIVYGRAMDAPPIPVYIADCSYHRIIRKHTTRREKLIELTESTSDADDTMRFFAPVYIRQQVIDPGKGTPRDPRDQIVFVSDDMIRRRQTALSRSHGPIHRMPSRSEPPARGNRSTVAKPSKRGGGHDNNSSNSSNSNKKTSKLAVGAGRPASKKQQQPQQQPDSADDTESSSSVATSDVDTSDDDDDINNDVVDANDGTHLAVGPHRIKRIQLGFNGIVKGSLGKQPTQEQLDKVQREQFNPHNARHMPSMKVDTVDPEQVKRKEMYDAKKEQHAQEAKQEAAEKARGNISVASTKANAPMDRVTEARLVARSIIDDISAINKAVRATTKTSLMQI